MRILVIDHDPGTAHIIKSMLEEHDVEAARDAHSGLLRLEAAALEQPFSVVLCDAALPDLPSTEVVDALHARLDRPFVVLMVGIHDHPLRLGGADAALLKPFGVCELRDIVTSAAWARATAPTHRIRREPMPADVIRA